MAFVLYGTLSPNEGRMLIGGTTVPQSTIIVASGAMQLGDKVEIVADSNTVQTGAGSTAGNPPLGICVAVCDRNGIAVDPDAGTLDTFTVSSTNVTDATKNIYAVVDISTNTLYTVPLDATAGTTTGSDMMGYTFNTLSSNGDQLDENTATAITTASGEFFSWGIDPNNSSNAIVNMVSGCHHREIA